MHALIVVAHPEPDALTHTLARQVAEGLTYAGHSSEIADLAAERFDPRFTPADLAVHRRLGPPSAAVVAEQRRIEGADALVLVYPVYWWSFPALLKGWIDRVFSNGWAFDYDVEGRTTKRLGHLNVHLLALGGADQGLFARHGYDRAMRTQIEHGIFDWCGAQVSTSLLLDDSEGPEAARHLQQAHQLGRSLFDLGAQAPLSGHSASGR
ncbi:NAD(P)H-dependent oxidoreductase [uncultured Pseudomonas sp.]|uniref:NAD(P)H-dependent oxidoreductase n=1 Tax=uncultured Pseudomonas sp. TaxID=114707 RepID=UPI0025F59152|nr:NAD(P)H-dependent oxidoreductase [uncultured Pseudomonas sp.]